MRLFFVLGLLQSLVSAQTDGGECTYAVELMILQDASTSFDPWVEEMGSEIRSIMTNFTGTYAEFKMGVSSFVDKPIPTLGIGRYGDKRGWVEDYCYSLHHPLTSSPEGLEAALKDLLGNMGSGGDWPEAPLDGLAYTIGDKTIGWSTEPFSPGGRPNVRVVVVVTDDVAHQPNDVDLAVHQSWEFPRKWTDPTTSTGGFGATSYFRSSGAFDTRNSTSNPLVQVQADYMAMSSLFYKYDSKTITDAEVDTLKKWIDKFGPYPWPQILPNPNDGADPSLCDVTEYISLEALGALINAKNVVPVFIAASNEDHGPEMDDVCDAYGVTADADCLARYYQELLDLMGVRGVSITMNQGNLKEKIIEAVSSVTEMLCLTTSTTSTTIPLTTSSTTTTPVSEVPEPLSTKAAAVTEGGDDTTTRIFVQTSEEEVAPPEVESTADVVAPPEVESTADVVAPPEVESTANVVVPPEVDSTVFSVVTDGAVQTDGEILTTKAADQTSAKKTKPEAETTTEKAETASETTGLEGAAVVPPPEGGSNAGTIAGATAGAAAGVAAVGGVLFKKFGASLFGNSPSVPVDTVQQVEVPENPIERETMEEVTMDMFQ